MLAQQAGCVAEINSIEQSGGMYNMMVFISGIVCGVVGVGVLMVVLMPLDVTLEKAGQN